MTAPEPTPNASADPRLLAEVIALRADLVSVIKQAERLLEAGGVSVESVVVTRRERRHLTRRTKR